MRHLNFGSFQPSKKQSAELKRLLESQKQLKGVFVISPLSPPVCKRDFMWESRKNAKLLFTSNLLVAKRQTQRSDSIGWSEPSRKWCSLPVRWVWHNLHSSNFVCVSLCGTTKHSHHYCREELKPWTKKHPRNSTLPLLLLQSSDDPLQLASLLPLHGLQDLGGTLGLTAGGALATQRLAVLQDQGVLVVPVCGLKSEQRWWGRSSGGVFVTGQCNIRHGNKLGTNLICFKTKVSVLRVNMHNCTIADV